MKAKKYSFRNLALLYFIIISLFPFIASTQSLLISDLRCEYLNNPVGIDATEPRLTWRIDGSRKDIKQAAYQIYVSMDSLSLKNTADIQWNSGKVNSSASLIPYTGESLQPFTRYYWRTDVWVSEDEVIRSPIAFFETGMMKEGRWKGSWISDDNNIHVKQAPYFRKVFKAGRKIKRARAYITAAGLYELYLNGSKVGNHALDPVYTRYDRRNLYVTYDVTSHLQSGNNTIGVLLGNGWYNHQSIAVWEFHKAPWRGRPAFCMDLQITYENGAVETIYTDKSWKTSLSPHIFNSIYTAEHYDARLEQKNWNHLPFNDSSWKGVIYRAAPSSNIVSQALHPIRHVEKVPAQSLRKINDTTWVYDLGRNISGVTQLKVKAPGLTKIRLKHGERLYKNGRVDLSNIDVHYRPVDKTDPFQTDIVIFKGVSEESFIPLFNYKGFQYIEVTSSKPLKLTKESLIGYFMHSDVPPTGSIQSSNPTLDKIWWATNNSYLSNLFGYPTDCPQREKNGWTGDAHIAMETGLYNFDGITIYEKWMADHRDEQQPNGVLPSIIPTNGWGYEWANGPDWTSTIALVPWHIYLFYGDIKALADNYENIKRYVDHIHELYPSGLTTWGLGDWVAVSQKPPVEFTSSIYFYADAAILAKAAHLIGKKDDHKKYSDLAGKIKEAINTKYLNRTTGSYGTGLQTELSAPLYWGIVPDDLREKVAQNLVSRVKKDSLHLNVGLLGTKTILNALSDNGYADLAYKIASQETYPSWGWWIKNGATTLYENWNIKAASDISLNHIMFGEIGAWLFKAPGGIKPDPEKPGFEHILLHPHFVEGLDSFEAKFNSVKGPIMSSWKKRNENISYSVSIPPNTTATLYLALPDNKHLYEGDILINHVTGIDAAGLKNQNKKVYSLNSGVYHFEIR